MLQACEGKNLPKRVSDAIPSLVFVVMVVGLGRKGTSQWNGRVDNSVARTQDCSTGTSRIQGVSEGSSNFACNRSKVQEDGV